MPTYEYKCRKCGCQFERFQSIKAPPLRKCPQCGGRPERLISGGAGLLFKGSGFHITDYRSEGYRKAARAESSAPAASASAPASGADAPVAAEKKAHKHDKPKSATTGKG